LADVRARKVDVIVVYKVDRLTRSLADFAKLVELFDGHGVPFVGLTVSDKLLALADEGSSERREFITTEQRHPSETRNIPIVFAQINDPVGAGVVTTLARPGGPQTHLQGTRLRLCVSSRTSAQNAQLPTGRPATEE
jgi:hypothetical protein